MGSRCKKVTVKEADGGLNLETYHPSKAYDEQGRAKVVTSSAAAQKEIDAMFGKDGKKRTTLPHVALDIGNGA